MVPAVRFRYRKAGDYRFLSHLDWRRFLERAFRRAGVPLRFSQGYNPHPRIFLAGELPTGVAGLNEWALVETTEEIDAEQFRTSLDDQLPDPLGVHEAVASPTRKIPPVAVSHWTFELAEPVAPEAVERLAGDGPLEVVTKRKGVERTVDLRPYIITAEATGSTLDLVSRHEDGRYARPRDILSALEFKTEAALATVVTRTRVILDEPGA